MNTLWLRLLAWIDGLYEMGEYDPESNREIYDAEEWR